MEANVKAVRLARLEELRDTVFEGSSKKLAAKIKRSESQVSQWFTGIRTITEDSARHVERSCGLPSHWMDSADTEHHGSLAVPAVTQKYEAPIPSIHVPQMAAAGSMGTGVDRPSEDVITGTLTVSAEWAARELHIPSSRVGMLRFITGYGESMRPTFSSGDVLLVDTAAVSVDVDGIYVLSADNQLFIKRVTRGLDGKFEVTSDNPVVRKVQQLDGEHEIQVLGRVVWVWNGKKV